MLLGPDAAQETALEDALKAQPDWNRSFTAVPVRLNRAPPLDFSDGIYALRRPR